MEDGGSQLTRSVLDLSTRAVLAIAAHTGSRVAEVLGAKWGDQVVPTSNEQVVVLADGVEVTPGEETTRLLSAKLEWLDKLVMAAIELKSSAFRRLTGSTRDRVLGILRSTKVRHARKVSIEIGGVVVAPPWVDVACYSGSGRDTSDPGGVRRRTHLFLEEIGGRCARVSRSSGLPGARGLFGTRGYEARSKLMGLPQSPPQAFRL